jgi:hypothetical protein
MGVGSAHSDDQIVQDLAGGNCPQPGLFRFRRPAAENPTKQRRYFVKEGVFVDHEDEKPITCAGETVKGISDRLPFDLKTLFSKLSLR